MQAISARGLESRLKPPSFSLTDPHWQKEYSKNVYLRTDSLNQALLCHFSQHWPETKVGVTSAVAGCPISAPYPKIFTDPNQQNSPLPILTSWNSSKGSGTMLRKMSERVTRINLNKLFRFKEAGLEADDLNEVLEDLDVAAKCFEPDTLLWAFLCFHLWLKPVLINNIRCFKLTDN